MPIDVAKPNRAAILQQGKVTLHIKMPGIIQRITFTVERIASPTGTYPVLKTDRTIPMPELLRVAEDCSLPVVAKNATTFPKGTSAASFAGL